MVDDYAKQLDELERLRRINAIYGAVIARYRNYIAQEEGISVAELPRLVTPKNSAVAKKAKELLSGIDRFNYERDFYEASVLAYNFVKDSIREVILPMEFWLEPEEVLEFSAGEKIDRYVLLCSLLIAMGNPSSRILMYTKGEKTFALVYYELGGKIYAMNFDSGIKRFEKKEELLSEYGIMNADEVTMAYEFNDKMYIDIA
ncbi:MAG: hypothetical protein M1125_01645 [Candidatus Marsarchaeota archaeon]|nr:hypothetical protein [Candidatus Marsarchaeota archaeon]